MPFIKEFETILRKADKSIYKLSLTNGITCSYIDPNLNLISSNNILKGKYNIYDVWFDLDINNTMYGIINDKVSGYLSYINMDDTIRKCNLIKYNKDRFKVMFPYIKKTNTNHHIIYYLIDNKLNSTCDLIDYYKKDGQYIPNKIDTLNFGILSNFIVTWNNNIPTIFYFKLIDGYEEVFSSTLDVYTNTWSTPLQITNTKRNKLYLSVVREYANLYHIVFSENFFNKYRCHYINGYLEDDSFNTSKSLLIGNTIGCTFPHLIQYNSIIYIQWIEYHDLYTCYSNNFGHSWSNPILDETGSKLPFTRYQFISNSDTDSDYKLSTVFGCKDSIKLLGF